MSKHHLEILGAFRGSKEGTYKTLFGRGYILLFQDFSGVVQTEYISNRKTFKTLLAFKVF